MHGADIAPSMLDLTEKCNKHRDRCRYRLNEADDLGVFRSNTFDFILSIITLQHMQLRYSRNYIREFLRVLASGGLLVFQLPNDPIAGAVDGSASSRGWKQFVRSVTPEVLLGFYSRVRRLVESRRSSQPRMEMVGGSPEDVANAIEQRMGMWGAKREEVKKLIEQNGGKILDVLKGSGCRARSRELTVFHYEMIADWVRNPRPSILARTSIAGSYSVVGATERTRRSARH